VCWSLLPLANKKIYGKLAILVVIVTRHSNKMWLFWGYRPYVVPWEVIIVTRHSNKKWRFWGYTPYVVPWEVEKKAKSVSVYC